MNLLHNKTLLALFAATFGVFASFTCFFPVFPLHLKGMGASHFQVGMVMSAFPIGVLAFRPAGGWLVSHHGRKKTIVFGAAALTIFSGLYLVVDSLTSFFVVRFFHGFGISAFTTASIVLISDVVPSRNRGQMMGLMGVANYLGFGFGPYFSSIIYHRFGIDFIFLFATGTAALSLVISRFILEPPREAMSAMRREKIAEAVVRRWFLVPTVFILIAALIHGLIVIFLPLLLQERAIPLDSGQFFLFFALSVLVVRILAGKASDHFGRGIVLAIASLLVTVSLVLLWRVNSQTTLIAAAIFYGSGYGSQQPTLSVLIADTTNYANRSLLFSIYYATFDTGILLAGYLFGWIADWSSVSAIFLVAVVIYILAILFFNTQIQARLSDSIRWMLLLKSHPDKCGFCMNPMDPNPCHLCRRKP